MHEIFILSMVAIHVMARLVLRRLRMRLHTRTRMSNCLNMLITFAPLLIMKLLIMPMRVVLINEHARAPARARAHGRTLVKLMPVIMVTRMRSAKITRVQVCVVVCAIEDEVDLADLDGVVSDVVDGIDAE